jgi:hypothetical protein
MASQQYKWAQSCSRWGATAARPPTYL